MKVARMACSSFVSLSCLLVFLLSISATIKSTTAGGKNDNPPNIIVFIVDDMGWNQVGYHANAVGNDEIQTPYIDEHARMGIEMNRSYMTQWCGPSRAALQTGTTTSFNGNISNDVVAFDDDIGYVGGMPPGTRTIAHALKDYGKMIGKEYTAYYNGKWGIGGTAWANTPMGMGYDGGRVFWGDSIEPCDGRVTVLTLPAATPNGRSPINGAVLSHILPGYFEQDPQKPSNYLCDEFEKLPDELLSPEEKFVACKTVTRTPSKHIDEDLLDNVVGQIRTHDYEKGPLLQMFAPQALHTPATYPERFSPESPPHMKPGAKKPIPSPNDQRLATASSVRFVDYLFGETVKAVKEAGQWENTIILFTSDNGGSIYTATVNNNYPLRAMKFTPFEGGVRVPQFFSGGWINSKSEIGDGVGRVSNTYMFALDLAPTLLDMVGAGSEFLFGNKKGAVYGSEMWTYIKNSVTGKPKETWQKPRQVSYSPTLFFNVETTKMIKKIFTGTLPILTPRHWEPVYPKDSDFLMDNSYYSVQPCRPNGPQDCCVFDVESDPREFYPLPADCNKLELEAQNLYVIDEDGCQYENGKWNNNLCITPSNVTVTQHYAQNYSIWSQYGAAGPFTNAAGVPIETEMKCVCQTLSDGVDQSEIKYYTPVIGSLGQCQKVQLNQGVECNGAFTLTPQGGQLASLAAQGVDVDAYVQVQRLTQGGLAILTLKELYQTYVPYGTRTGFNEWPNFAKQPFIALGQDTCTEKGFFAVPMPATSLTPYLYGSPNPSVPYTSPSLCLLFDLENAFCTSLMNAEMKPVKRWEFNYDEPGKTRGILADGSILPSISSLSCNTVCPVTPEGTAYIGGPETLPSGIRVDYVTATPTKSPPTPAPSCGESGDPCKSNPDCCDGFVCNTKKGTCSKVGGMMMMDSGKAKEVQTEIDGKAKEVPPQGPMDRAYFRN